MGENPERDHPRLSSQGVMLITTETHAESDTNKGRRDIKKRPKEQTRIIVREGWGGDEGISHLCSKNQTGPFPPPKGLRYPEDSETGVFSLKKTHTIT